MERVFLQAQDIPTLVLPLYDVFPVCLTTVETTVRTTVGLYHGSIDEAGAHRTPLRLETVRSEMAPNPADIEHLTLIVQRLSDADLILPEEAEALLEKIAAPGVTPGESPDETGEGLYRMLEALVQTDRQDIPASKEAQEIVRRILEDGSP